MASRKSVFSNFIWRFLERSGAQIVTFVVSIVLARLLDPVVYGIVALVTVITTILQVFVDSGLGNALIQKKNADDTDFSTVFYFNILVCAVLYTALFFAAPFIAKFYEMPELTPVIRVLGTILIISGVKNVQQAYVSKHLLFKRFFWATLGGTLCAAGVGIWMAYKGFGVWALVAQYLVNAAMDTIILWITVKFRPKFLFSWKRLGGLFKYGWKLLVSALLDTGYNELRALIIGKKYSSEDLAFYNKGDQFPKVIATNINTSIDSVLLPVMSEEQDNRERVKMMTRRAIKTSSFILWPLMMGLAACAEPVVSLLLTDKWLPCVLFMRVFCITYAFYPIHTANLNAIKAMGRSDLFLILEIIKKTIGLGLILGFMWISVEAMAYSCIISSICSQIINSWPNKKLLKYSYLEQLKDILPSIGLSLFMAGCVYCVGFLHLNNWLTLLIQVPLGAIIYILGAKIFKFEAFDYFLSVVKSFFNRKNNKTEENMAKERKITMNNKKILILGGAGPHVKLVETAKEMGLYTVVTDCLSDSPAKVIADERLDYDIYDYENIVAYCKNKNIDGVIGLSLDPVQKPAQKIASMLGLRSFGNEEQVLALTNKHVFKKACQECGVDVVPEYKSADDNMVYPVLVKPDDSRGSRGITICYNKNEVENAIKIAQKDSSDNSYLIESYLENVQEVTITYIVKDGYPYLISLGDRFPGKKEDGLDRQNIGVIQPSRYTKLFTETVDKKVRNLIKHLGIKNGPVFMQGLCDGNKIMMFDPGIRFPGNEYERIFIQATGLNPMKSILNYIVYGEIEDYNKQLDGSFDLNGKVAIQYMINLGAGKVSKFEGLDIIRKHPNVIFVDQRHFVGDNITQTGDIKHRAGEIDILVDRNVDKIIGVISFIQSNLVVLNEKGENQLISPMNQDEILNLYNMWH